MHRVFSLLASALLAVGVTLAVAASDTLTQSHSGATPPLSLFDLGPAVCDPCIPDALYGTLGGSGTGDIGFGFEVHASANASYTGDTDTVVNWTPGLVRQGSTLDTSDTLTPQPGTARLSYTLSGTVGIYNDPDGGADTWSPVGGETVTLSYTFNQDIPCTLPLPGEAPRTCSKTDFINIYTANIIVDITLRLGIETSITLNSNGVVTIRHAEVAGGPAIANNTITFAGTSPSTVADPFFITCTQPVNTDLTYALTNTSYSSPNTAANYSVFLNVLIEEPLVGTDLFDADITPHVAILGFNFGTLTTTAPDKVANLGPVLPDATPPTIDSVGGPYSGNEGSPINFVAVAHDNCGPPLLRWDFSDGGVAYGPNVWHTFVDNGVYSGLLTATDITGLQSTATFSVTVLNVTPTVSGGPDVQFDWGQPVSFHGNGADAGAVDNLSLLYSWGFDDPDDPLGGAGQDVSHTYSQPGSRTAVVTVDDKDGASNTDSLSVTITKRETTSSYTGAVSGNKTDTITLRATLVDEYAAPVVGRVVDFKIDGTSVGTALTNGLGVATLSWTIPVATSVGSHSVSANFTTDSMYNGSSAASSVMVSKENSILTDTSVLKAKPSKAVPLSATLTDDEGNPIQGKTIAFTLGTQGCSGTTNASGIASCTIAKLTQNPGNYTLTASFAGDTDYNLSTDSDPFRIGN